MANIHLAGEEDDVYSGYERTYLQTDFLTEISLWKFSFWLYRPFNTGSMTANIHLTGEEDYVYSGYGRTYLRTDFKQRF